MKTRIYATPAVKGLSEVLLVGGIIETITRQALCWWDAGPPFIYMSHRRGEGVITIHYLCCKFMLVNIFACIEDTSMLYKRVMTTLSDDLLCVAPCTSQWKSITILLCKAEKQYLVSCKVSRYVFGFARQGPIPQKILKLGLSWLDYTRNSSW